LTEALASRVAGLKLGGIVGVLLLPMLVLSFFMVNSIRNELAFAQREIKGVELSRLVMPVAFGAALRVVDADTIQSLREKGGPVAAELGVSAQFSTALAVLLTYGSDTRYAVGSLQKLQVDSSTSSNIILDPFAETYHLGTIVSDQGVSLLSSFVHLWTLESRAIRDGEITQHEATRLLLASGAWQEAQKRLQTTLATARSSALNPSSYSKAMEAAAEMAQHPDRITEILSASNAEQLVRQISAADEFGGEAGHLIHDIQTLWSFSADRFETLLRERISAMQLRLYTLLAIAAAACLIGVGGAALMFRSTLRQLDDVKLAHDRAEAARLDAEDAAAEVQRINEDVVRLNADLAHNLAMLRDAQDENLRKGKMAQLGQLTATVAHELRNPLGAVRTSAFLLERKVKNKGLGIEAQLERINNGVTRCDNIISQLLDFARTKAIQPESVVLDDWLSKLVEEEAQKLPAVVAIECEFGLGSLSVPFDPARMSRAVINLMSNASEALVGKGDDPAKYTSKFPLIRISTAMTPRGAELSISDNGPGIPADHAAKIFEPLFTTKNFGTGLGLSAVEKIMEQHGGGIDVDTAPGKGAAFTLWWPMPQAGGVAA
jgi:signal transduction histidine kinase